MNALARLQAHRAEADAASVLLKTHVLAWATATAAALPDDAFQHASDASLIDFPAPFWPATRPPDGPGPRVRGIGFTFEGEDYFLSSQPHNHTTRTLPLVGFLIAAQEAPAWTDAAREAVEEYLQESARAVQALALAYVQK